MVAALTPPFDDADAIRFELVAGDDPDQHEELVDCRDLPELLARLGVWLRARVSHRQDGVRPGDRYEQIVMEIPAGRAGAIPTYLVVEPDPPELRRASALIASREDMIRACMARHVEAERSSSMAGRVLVEAVLSDAADSVSTQSAQWAGFDLTQPIIAMSVRILGVGEGMSALDHCLGLSSSHPARSRAMVLPEASGDALILRALCDGPDPVSELWTLAGDRWSDVAIGIGSPGIGAAGLKESILHSRRAVELASRKPPGDRIVGYRADEASEGATDRDWLIDPVRFATNKLGPLLGVPAERSTFLLETLTTVLRSSSHAEAAAALYIHHSTLRYRIEQIERILEISFKNADDRFDTELALRILYPDTRP
jgi:hypothetical protein